MVVLAATGAAFGQQPTNAPSFEAASIKVSPPLGGQNSFVGMKLDPGHLLIANFGLEAILTRAYGITGDQIVGVPAEFRYPLAYEIRATYPADTPKEQVSVMLQNLLAERFKLVVHREMRVAPVYALVVAKGGPKLTTSNESTMSAKNPRRGHIEYKKVTMEWFASVFRASSWTDRPVLNQTELSGEYDLVLDWTPDDLASNDPAAAPSLFTAIQQQLGLKLEPQTAPREFLIIDHVEKPTAN
jgi:uncharacterized protein (TIGR03435 family)